MTRVRIQSVLLDADGPLVIVLRDSVDGAWLGNAVERGPDGDRYLCVAISPGRLAKFRHGRIDLRSMFTDSDPGLLGSLFIPGRRTDDSLTVVSVPEVPADWLPEEGFHLTDFVEPIAAEYRALVSESVAQNRPILHLNLDPPDSSTNAVDVDVLGEALVLFQKAVRYANTAANRLLGPTEKKVLAAAENYKFEAFATAPSSFEVHLQAKVEGDPLFGYTPHVRALRKLDELVSVVDDTEAAIAIAKDNRGHFVTAIQALMEFVSSTNTPLSYAWATPKTEPVSHTIRPPAARALYDQLVAKDDLTRQEVELVGKIHLIDDERGSWRLEAGDGNDYSGTVSQEGGVALLTGLTTGMTYSLKCIEYLKETRGSGRESRSWELTDKPRLIEPFS